MLLLEFLLPSSVEAAQADLPSAVRQLIEDARPSLTGGKSLTELNQDFLERHKDSLDHVIPVSQVLYRLKPDCRSSAVGYVTNLSDSVEGRTLQVCVVWW